MRKHVDILILSASLCLFAATWLLATEKTAQAQIGSTGVQISGGGMGGTGGPILDCIDLYEEVCFVTGNAYCATVDVDDCEENMYECVYCSATNEFYGPVCVVAYINGCTLTSGSVTCVGNYYKGYCVEAGDNAPCECVASAQTLGCPTENFTYYYCDMD